MKIYRATIRPLTIYAAETICLQNREKEKSKVYEKKIIEKINGIKKIHWVEYRSFVNYDNAEILDEKI